MPTSEKKKKFYHTLIDYSAIIFLVGLIFCILYFEVGFYNIWIFIKKLTVLSIKNWVVSLPILGIVTGFSFFLFSMFLLEKTYELIKQGTILLFGSFLIFMFLSIPVHQAAKEKKQQANIGEIQQEKTQILAVKSNLME